MKKLEFPIPFQDVREYFLEEIGLESEDDDMVKDINIVIEEWIDDQSK